MTEQKKIVLRKALHAARCGEHYRAKRSGERVTLASLYRDGLLYRRAWRGKDGEPDSAYEYWPTDEVAEILGGIA